MQTAAIVLAAGAGTRMKSDKPKVAHEVLGKPLVNWVLDAAEEAGIERLVTVVGHKREQVIPLVEDRAEIVVQEEQRGTAHAVLSCSDALADFEGSLLVLSGDCPLITSETMKALIDMRDYWEGYSQMYLRAQEAGAKLIVFCLDDTWQYGGGFEVEGGGQAPLVFMSYDAAQEIL